jgi:hypothetical protein
MFHLGNICYLYHTRTCNVTNAAGVAAADGAAAAARDRAKRAHYARAGVGEACDLQAYDQLVPLSVDSFGHLGKPAMGLLNALADVAASRGGICRVRL